MRKSLVLISTLILLVASTSVFAQMRGKGRQQGVITDSATGKPIEGATVKLTPAKSSTIPIVVKTDKGGHWVAVGLTNGGWNVEISADGYIGKATGAEISEVQMGPLMQTKLDPTPKQEAKPADVAVAPTPLVPKEVVEEISAGQELVKQEKYADALVQFEKALPQIPETTDDLKTVKSQVRQVMAQAYYKTGNLKNAIAMLEAVTAADPANVPASLLLVNLYLENKQLDAGKSLLDKLPPAAITDPAVYINVGILFYNAKKSTEAVTYYDKAVALDAKSIDAHYYRGIALTQLNKRKEAKADFEQVLALAAPDSDQAKDAKTFIASLK